MTRRLKPNTFDLVRPVREDARRRKGRSWLLQTHTQVLSCVFCNANMSDFRRGLPGEKWRSWRHCATSIKVALSIPDGVIKVFRSLSPCGSAIALWKNQPLREMSTRGSSSGKGCRCVGLTTSQFSCTDCLWKSQFPGALRACIGISVTYWVNR
jgi:hypothetical protein